MSRYSPNQQARDKAIAEAVLVCLADARQTGKPASRVVFEQANPKHDPHDSGDHDLAYSLGWGGQPTRGQAIEGFVRVSVSEDEVVTVTFTPTP